MKKTLAIILSAGRGTRAGAGLPKTYREIDGAPIVRRSVEAFLSHPKIDQVQLVIHPDDQVYYHEAVQGLKLPQPVFGGSTRAESVKNGLADHDEYDFVLIHDGARPFVSHALIDRILEALETHQGVIPALPVSDALWRVDGDHLAAPVNRDELVAAQTPQGFQFAPYKSIASGGEVFDDAQAALQAGLKVVYVEGEKSNRKLTYEDDFQ